VGQGSKREIFGTEVQREEFLRLVQRTIRVSMQSQLRWKTL